jgi:hypothetical protein
MKLHCENHSLPASFLPICPTKECYSTHFVDEYTAVHYVNGVATKLIFPKLTEKEVLLSAVGFEIIENNQTYIQHFYKDGIYKGDSLLNALSDILVFYLGAELTERSSTIKRNKTKVLCGVVGVNALAILLDSKKVKGLLNP